MNISYFPQVKQFFGKKWRTQLLIPPSTFCTSQPLVEPLSKRELEILVLLAQRLPTRENAAKLLITLNIVKKHLSNIYRKLRASSRRQVAEKARALGIRKRR